MNSRRFVVLGAGAVGATIGAALIRAGRHATLVARGEHLDALRRDGLVVETPSETWRMRVDAVAHPHEIAFADADAVIVCTKSQDTEAALDALAHVAPRRTPIVCAQNGVSNERVAAERFDDVYAAVVWIPASHLAPGRVAVHAEPVLGGFDVGRFPHGCDAVARSLVEDLRAAGFDARADDDVMRTKYGKLLTNLGNAVGALVGRDADVRALVARLQSEAIACFRAAGIAFARVDEVIARFAKIRDLSVAGVRREGGSSWQSLARATGSIETDHLNGEIVRLGERHGVPTPMNDALTQIALRAARERWPPGRWRPDELVAALEREIERRPERARD